MVDYNDCKGEPTAPQVQINARLILSEKQALLSLAKNKGAEGITGLLKMLAKAKKVSIEL